MANISKPSTFTANTAIEPAEVNDNFDTIYNEFNGGISASNLATDAVTTAKIADANVTTAKIADANVTNAKIAAEAWTTWTPTFYNSGGTITATATDAKYIQIGKTVHWQLRFAISAVSVGGTARFSAPVTARYNLAATGQGREDAVVGSMIFCMFKSSATEITCFFYNNTGNTATAGYTHSVSGTYEAA